MTQQEQDMADWYCMQISCLMIENDRLRKLVDSLKTGK